MAKPRYNSCTKTITFNEEIPVKDRVPHLPKRERKPKKVDKNNADSNKAGYLGIANNLTMSMYLPPYIYSVYIQLEVLSYEIYY